MGRPRAQYPTPGRRLRGATWQVFWSSGGTSYAVSVGQVPEREAETRRLEVALALRTGEWPGWAQGAPAVERYGAQYKPPAGDLLAEYETGLRVETSSGWAATAMGHLRELHVVAAVPLSDVTAREAQAFLEHIVSTPGPVRREHVRSGATRNRALSSCSRFYKWAVRTGRLRVNPFQGIGRLPEPEPAVIGYLTRRERNAILRASNRLRDGVAVWLALWAGLRRGEIARAAWSGVNLETGRLIVLPGKTKRRRVVPLARPFISYLRRRMPMRGSGQIVPWPAEEAQWRWTARLLLEALQDACPGVPAERIRWNAFRHTFGSLLAQAGVSLDKIAAWMGNSPRICRRHYAEFVPRDRRDEEIDCL